MADTVVKKVRRQKATGLFAVTELVKLEIPKPILDRLQTAADDAILPLPLYLIKALAGTLPTE
jgi:hypothetical protein